MADQHWKDLDNAQLIMYRVNDDNKWQILEYFAQNNHQIFKDIVKSYVRVRKTETVYYTLDEIVEHYKDSDMDLMPQALKELVQTAQQKGEARRKGQLTAVERSTEVNHQRKRERKLSWEKEAGVPLVLFEVDNLTPKTRDDYFAVFMRYMSENLTIPQFCRKYNINSTIGFKEMLDKFATESVVYAEQIKIKHESKQYQDINKINKLIDYVCLKDLSVAALVENNDLASLYEWQYQAQMHRGEKYCNLFRKKVIDYFYDRVNSYDFYSIEPENIKKMLTREELIFIVGEAEFDSMMAGRSGTVQAPFIKSVIELGNINAKFIEQKVRGKTNDKIEKALDYYNDKFDKNQYFENKTMVLGPDGKSVEVTPEMVDRAYQFVYANGLFPSEMVMNRAIRAVACEKIDNKQQTAEEMQELIKQADIMVDKIKNIEDYLNYIDSWGKK